MMIIVLLRLREGAHHLRFLYALWFDDAFFPTTRERLLDDLTHLSDLIDAHEGIDFRQQLREFLAKTLRQAARHDHALVWIAGIAKLRGLQNGIDAFFLRGINERTGVHDHRVRLLRIVDNLHASAEQ
jgi:hypothetical protein